MLTVDEKYYEEALDPFLEKLLPPSLRIEKVNALPVTRPRLIGDIGLRAFVQLYRKAKGIITSEQVDFVYILIPSFYTALLGRWLHRTTGAKYGIDYIDPWVHDFAGSHKIFSRHWISTRLAGLLEPVAVKHASLITGVGAGYYAPVLERNPQLQQRVHGAMPYGGEVQDHVAVQALQIDPYLFSKHSPKQRLVYAGAMLPKAYEPLEQIMKSIVDNPQVFADTEFHFIGTGKTPDDPQGFNINPLAEKYGLWQKVIFEYPKRIPYLDVLVHLGAADGIFILGSTEPHYTPSKVYQGVLSGKPILAVLHKDSSAVEVLEKSNGGIALTFNGTEGLPGLEKQFSAGWPHFQQFLHNYNPAQVNQSAFNEYSAATVTKKLAGMLDQALQRI